MTRRPGPVVVTPSSMSISPQSHTVTTAEDAARDLTDLYLILVHEAPEVCSNCHERIRDREEHDHESNTLGTGNKPTETIERAGEGVVGYDHVDKDGYGAIRHHKPRTYCGPCGRPNGRARDDCPPKAKMLQAVRPLVKRFDRVGVPLNDDVLFQAVNSLRSNPEFRGLETEIWRAAVAVAAKRARPRDCVRCTYGRED